MNEETAGGAVASIDYFLDLYTFMTGNTTEIAAMSEDGCVFCKSVIDRANDLHKGGGWANEWEQDITNIRYYNKPERYDCNRIKVAINCGATISYPEAGAQPQPSEPTKGQVLNFRVRYSGGH